MENALRVCISINSHRVTQNGIMKVIYCIFSHLNGVNTYSKLCNYIKMSVIYALNFYFHVSDNSNDQLVQTFVYKHVHFDI